MLLPLPSAVCSRSRPALRDEKPDVELTARDVGQRCVGFRKLAAWVWVGAVAEVDLGPSLHPQPHQVRAPRPEDRVEPLRHFIHRPRCRSALECHNPREAVVKVALASLPSELVRRGWPRARCRARDAGRRVRDVACTGGEDEVKQP